MSQRSAAGSSPWVRRALVALLLLALTSFAARARLPQSPWLRWVSDALDPVAGALRLADDPLGWRPHAAWFGLGRDAAWLAGLSLAGDRGLPGLAVVLAWMGALLPPAVAAAVVRTGRRVNGWTLLGASLGGALLVESPDLLDTAASGFEGYGSAGLTGAAWLLATVGPRRGVGSWAGTGFVAGLATSHHLYAAPAAGAALLLRHFRAPLARPGLAWATGLLAFSLPLLPQIALTVHEGPAETFDLARQAGEHPAISYFDAAAALLAGADRACARAILLGPLLLVLAVLLATPRGPSSRAVRRGAIAWLAAGTVGVLLAPLLVMASHHANPWHWRSHLPWLAGSWGLAVVLAGGGALRSQVAAVVTTLLGLALVLLPARDLLRTRHRSPEGAIDRGDVLARLDPLLPSSGPRLGLAAYASWDADPMPDLAALGVHLRLRGGPHLAETWEAAATAPTLVVAPSPPVRAGDPKLPAPTLALPGLRLWLVEDGATARALGARLCTEAPARLRALPILEAVLHHDRTGRWSHRLGPGAHPCATDPEAPTEAPGPPLPG
jgi:hypothetical protein